MRELLRFYMNCGSACALHKDVESVYYIAMKDICERIT